MSSFIEIPAENIIKESIAEISGYRDIPYVIYINPDDPRDKIRINTDFSQQGDTYEICRFYDRGLCNTIKELKKIP